MNPAAIRIDRLSKQYRIGRRQARYRTLREVLAGSLQSLRRAPGALFGGLHANASNENVIWALENVSLEIQRGETVGVIGSNGAGKSTLLKILSRITEPTSGYAEIRGRVGSLLEVGTGFHPELSGRENIFLNGAILGMKRVEIESRFDEVVAFAGVERFIDTPVKHYSSGMYLRLAFAVAAHLEPEILLVDEVLAVGDAAFQRKCLGKIGQAARGGKTVLFVSHNMTALQSLCNRAIWLRDGSVAEDGDARTVVSRYLQSEAAAQQEVCWPDPQSAPGGAVVRLNRVHIAPCFAAPRGQITVETPFEIEVAYWNLLPGAVLNVSLVLYNIEDVCVFNVISRAAPRPAGLLREVCEVPANLLNDSSYRVRVLIVKDASVCLLDVPNIVSFEVHESGREAGWYGKWVGAVRPALQWRTEWVPEPHAVLR